MSRPTVAELGHPARASRFLETIGPVLDARKTVFVPSERSPMESDEREPRLRSDLALRRRTLWLGEMELYDDELAISGWRWTGSVWRPIPIEDIRQVEKWPAPEGMVNLVIRPEHRDDFYCRVEEGIFYWVKEFRDDERTNLVVRT